MPPRKVPGTGEIYFSNPHTGDRILNLKNYPNLGSSLKNEDVVVIGDFEDYSGSGTKPGQQVMMAGVSDELAGDLHAQAAGKDFNEVTNRGKTAATHRQRPRLVHVDE